MKIKSIQDLASPIKCVGSEINWCRPRSVVNDSNSIPSFLSTSFSHNLVDRQLKSPVMTTQNGFSACILDSISSKFIVKLSNSV